ncbi:DciA family protein [Streptomyces sp. S1D4-14]|uniref:DciA family protein n=1 Tax=Streptomyces sp. S1D4-14 TaxID=2594461 RepID=UPI0015E7083C|nr:DciA family protein [Streptomyces sp. S1D4-14]
MNDQQRPDSEARVDLAVLALRRAREDARRGRFTERAPASRRRRVRGRTPPVLLSQALLDLFSASGTSPLPAWHSVAGPLAQHVIPTAFDPETGTLTVASATEAWLTQTRLLADRLTQRLNDVLGAGTVRHIRVLKRASSAVLPPPPTPHSHTHRWSRRQCRPIPPSRRL